jgi:hypothetical protein
MIRVLTGELVIRAAKVGHYLPYLRLFSAKCRIVAIS